jgi:hypothetical protein
MEYSVFDSLKITPSTSKFEKVDPLLWDGSFLNFLPKNAKY